MNQWTPQNIAALITAAAGAIAAVFAGFHSIQTRKQITNANTETNAPANANPAQSQTPGTTK